MYPARPPPWNDWCSVPSTLVVDWEGGEGGSGLGEMGRGWWGGGVGAKPCRGTHTKARHATHGTRTETKKKQTESNSTQHTTRWWRSRGAGRREKAGPGRRDLPEMHTSIDPPHTSTKPLSPPAAVASENQVCPLFGLPPIALGTLLLAHDYRPVASLMAPCPSWATLLANMILGLF